MNTTTAERSMGSHSDTMEIMKTSGEFWKQVMRKSPV
jgi:hypothetical protein